MSRVFVLFLSIILVVNSTYARDQTSDYRVVVLDFNLIADKQGFENLSKDLANALEQVLTESKSVTVLERDQYSEVLEIVEYQFKRRTLFDSTTIAKLNKRIGANMSIIGEIRQEADEIRIDVAMVEIESSVRLASQYLMVKFDNYPSLSQQDDLMRILGQRLLRELFAEDPIPSETEKSKKHRESKYKLVVMNFQIDPPDTSLDHLREDLPIALDVFLGQSECLDVMDRVLYTSVIDNIEYRWGSEELFDALTATSIRKEVGAAAVQRNPDTADLKLRRTLVALAWQKGAHDECQRETESTVRGQRDPQKHAAEVFL